MLVKKVALMIAATRPFAIMAKRCCIDGGGNEIIPIIATNLILLFIKRDKLEFYYEYVKSSVFFIDRFNLSTFLISFESYVYFKQTSSVPLSFIIEQYGELEEVIASKNKKR